MSIYQNLKDADPKLYSLLIKEKNRQSDFIELIASENYTSMSVLQASCSLTHNKYSEGTVGNRYYGGTDVIDEIESLCQKRALELYKLDDTWDVNVQSYSGSVANFQVFNALIGKDGKLMGMHLFSGGHLSHGFQINKKIKVSVTSKYFESIPYEIESDGKIDYDKMEKIFVENKIKILILGASAYPGDFDYKRAREIADKNNAYLMCDMAHISGLIATGKMNNPFEYCDVVTTTVQKMLRGPKAALIFYKKMKNGVNIKNLIDKSVFPGSQGGPHNQTIAGIAAALKLANTPEYTKFINQLLANIQVFVKVFRQNKIKIFMDGTVNHLILVDMRNLEIKGTKYSLKANLVEWTFNFVNISINKNSLPDDQSARYPSGIRIGSNAITTRGYKEIECEIIANFIVDILANLEKYSSLDEKEFKDAIRKDKFFDEIREKIIQLARKHPIPGAELLEKINE